MLNQNSAVLFHVRDINITDLPGYRDPQQNYVFHLLESPPHTGTILYDIPPGFFNLTFTYRLDSDIIADSYFQHYRPPMWTDEKSFDEVWSLKKKLAVAFVSNCHTSSLREYYLEELEEYMPADIYGKCGTVVCNGTSLKKECDTIVSSYKFYLAFENR